MRVLVFHGYLLRGTGSNVYNAELAAALVRLEHEVHLLCQDREPEALPFVDAHGSWDGGELEISQAGDHEGAPRCTVYRPDIDGLLPTYVADRYDAIEARPFHELSDEELDRYIELNVAAVREVVERAGPDVALANHLVMGPLILARALEGNGVPYAVKIHGSALEYTVKPHPRFLPHAREGLAGARGVLVGSRHTAESLWAAMEDDELGRRTRLGPPGVDVHAFQPRSPEEAAAGIERLSASLTPGEDDPPAADDESVFARDPEATARALAALDPAGDRLVAFVGKLIVSKGIDLLLAAWPLVLERVPAARLVVVGFGAFAQGAQQLVDALSSGDREEVRRLAEAGRELEDGPREPLAHLLAFFDALEPDAASSYFAAAEDLADRVSFIGRLEHHELAEVLPACEAMVVPSTFPEAFGMVAAEAAACGAFPVSAGHSGLAEVSAVLAEVVPEAAREWLTFERGPQSVEQIAERVCGWLEAPAELKEETREALVGVARDRYSWEGVARTVIAAAEGRLEDLPEPPAHPSA